MVAQVDEFTGEVVGAVDKDVAHNTGVWHATIHVWVLDHAGRVLLQQRAWNKAQFPGMWDISAAGHVAPGESGVREVQEELGAEVELGELEPVGVLTVEQEVPPVMNRERPRVYLWRSGRAADSFTFVDGEVIALAALTVSELETLTAGGDVSVAVWRGVETGVETIGASALVPLGENYWSALFAGLRRPDCVNPSAV